jgi:hypothetical protein
MNWLHHVAHDFDATRHFLFLQIHPVIWWGNIVAGLVVFVVINICWALFLKKWVHKFAAEVLRRHHEKVVAPLLKAQHEEHMAHLRHIIKHHPDIPPFVHRDETGKFTKGPQ